MAKIKIEKAPSHWPYVHPDQQFEGFKSMVDSSNITVWEFENRMRSLVKVKFMTKARMNKLITWFRKIRGISYEEYNAKRDTGKPHNQPPRGLWR